MKGGKALTRVLVALVLFGLGAAPARADFDEGRSAYQGGDYGAAFREFKNLAEKGVAEARFVLGSMYKNGQGVRQDQAEAVRWLTLAAKQGVAMAQYSLARQYLSGQGVDKNEKVALQWLLKAARRKLSSAQLVLGSLYRNGRGTKKNFGQAVKWYAAAAGQGNALAQANLGRMYAQGQGVPRNFSKAALWYRRAAEQGLAHGQSLLGAMLAAGVGMARNYTGAYFWLTLAARQGDKQAAAFRDEVGKNLKPSGRAEAAMRAATWRPKKRISFTDLSPDPLAARTKDFGQKIKQQEKQLARLKAELDTLKKARRRPGKRAGMRVLEVTRGAKPKTPVQSLPSAALSSAKPVKAAPLRPAKPKPAMLRPGAGFRDCANCPEMVVVPAGSFLMGGVFGAEKLPAKPVHKVVITHPFAIGKYEVTRGEYAEFAAATGRRAGSRCRYWSGDTLKDFRSDNTKSWRKPGFFQSDRHPVACVDWRDAKAYAAWLGKKTGKSYRLPSEAEWEYMARAGGRKNYFFGNSTDDLCRFVNGADGSMSFEWRNKACSDGYPRTAPVGSFRPNAFGLHDVHGNVSEWVEDCWNKSYAGAPSGPEPWTAGQCASRVIRGGSWMDDPGFLRYAYREGTGIGSQASHKGFRLARNLDK